MASTTLETVAEMIGDPRTDYDAPPQLIIPTAKHIAERRPDGLYFGLPEGEYHAEPRFSTSGTKNMLASTMDFWARSWLNGERDPDDDETTKAKRLGTAYHKRILEGREAFYSKYAAALDPADYPGALKTVEEIKAALTEAGAKPSGKVKRDFINQLRALVPAAEVWDDLVSEHAQRWTGYEFVAPDAIRRMEIAAAMIERHPDLSRLFVDGYSEVSLFWTCRQTGVPMKARLDYLKIKMIADLKTITNQFMKPFDTACANAIAGRGYFIQALVYQEGLAAVKAMVRREGLSVVHGDYDPEWVQKLAASPQPSFTFVFQQTGIAPVARGFRFPPTLLSYGIGADLALQARRKFASCLDAYGLGWWVDDAPIRDFDNLEFPAWIGKD